MSKKCINCNYINKNITNDLCGNCGKSINIKDTNVNCKNCGSEHFYYELICSICGFNNLDHKISYGKMIVDGLIDPSVTIYDENSSR